MFFFWLHQSHGGVDQGQHPSIYSEGFFNANGWKMVFPKTLTMSINLDKNKIPKDPNHVSIHPIFSWNEHGISWTRHAILDFPEVISIQGTGVPSRSGNDIPTFVEQILGLFWGPDNPKRPDNLRSCATARQKECCFFSLRFMWRTCIFPFQIPTPLFWENCHVNLVEKCRLFQWKLSVDKKGS